MTHMRFKSGLEWNSPYEQYRFSFKEWVNFLSFFRLDPDMEVAVPSRVSDENGVRVKERKIRLRELPARRPGESALKFSVQTLA